MWIVAIALIVGFTFSGCKSKGPRYVDTVIFPITAAVEKIQIAPPFFNEKVQQKTQVFYSANNFKKVWLGAKRPNNEYLAFIDEVKASSTYGLDPDDYDITILEQQVVSLYKNSKRTEADISDLDIKITASFFLYTTHLMEGRVRYPGAPDFIWERGMPLENDITMLLSMESAMGLRKKLERIQPSDQQYSRLQKAYKKFRVLQQADTIPNIAGNLLIKPGELNVEIPLIRRKLSLLDILNKSSRDESPQYDDNLVKGIKKFQSLHGLTADGVIQGETIKFLNMTMKARAELIALNLERLRWGPSPKGDNNEVVVNVPEFMLRVYNNHKSVLEMRVVTGSEFNATPVFHDSLKYIVFSPTWTVPKSIFENEFLPKLRIDSAHFSSERFTFYKRGKEIDPTLESWADDKLNPAAYRVIENPGPANSLGNVKFIMPNDFSIYLHDTPADRLFSKEKRAFSHGCIRLEKPLELAEYLVGYQKKWDKERVEEAIQSAEPLRVNLKKAYPVHIVYRTVWVDDANEINFRADIYGHDKRHLAQLDERNIMTGPSYSGQQALRSFLPMNSSGFQPSDIAKK